MTNQMNTLSTMELTEVAGGGDISGKELGGCFVAGAGGALISTPAGGIALFAGCLFLAAND